MRRLVLMTFCILVLGAGKAFAQQTRFNGSICDGNTGEPLPFVTVVARTADSTVVAATTSDEKGFFSFDVSPETVITASLIGYRESSPVQPSVDMLILLEKDSEMLEAATVTGKLKLVEMKIDKVVMNVSQSAFAQGSNGLELLRKAPGVTIDKDGNVLLNGKSVSIWIDGRPSYMDGEALISLLRSTSGESIDKFEIMEHPSAKYDAQGQGGIINIRTKRNFAKGFNGNLGFNGGGMYFGTNDIGFIPDASLWGNFAYRGRKTNTFVNLYDGYSDMAVLLEIDTRQPVMDKAFELKTHTVMNATNNNYQIKAGNDWFLDDRNVLGFIVSLPGGSSSNYADPGHNTSEIYLDGNLTEKIRSINDENSSYRRVTGNINYTHIFDESRSAEITTNLDWYRNGNVQSTYMTNFTSANGSETESRRNIDSDNTVNIYSAKTDYQTVLWSKAMFEAGAKWAMSLTDNKTIRTETDVPDNNTIFTYTEHIAAAYADIAMQLSPKFSFKAGLRGEYTHSLGDWKSAGEKTTRSYFDLFPTLFAGFNPSDKLNFAATYTRRIDRPSYWTMDPAESYADAHTIMVGNPELLPEYIDDFGLQMGFAQHFAINLGYTHTKNLSLQIPSIKENGDQILKWGNFGVNHLSYAVLSISSLPVTKWLDWSFNILGLYMNSVSETDTFTSSGFTAQGYTAFTFNLPSDWKIELDAQAQSSLTLGYYVSAPVFISNLAVRKHLLGNRLILNFDVNDIFRSKINDNTIMGLGPGTSSLVIQRYMSQSVTLGLSWNFGQAQQMRQRKVGNLDEASRVSE